MTCACNGWDEPFGPDHPLWLTMTRVSSRWWVSCDLCGRLLSARRDRRVYAGLQREGSP